MASRKITHLKILWLSYRRMLALLNLLMNLWL